MTSLRNERAATLPGASAGPTPTAGDVRARGFTRQLPAALRAMRPLQWTKNGLVVLAAIFAQRLTSGPTVAHVAAAVCAFCLAASAIYILNDIADREKDRLHPVKCQRPIASGALALPLALATGVLCLAGAALLTTLLLTGHIAGPITARGDPFALYGGSALLFAGTLGAYLALNIAYSLWLKHLVLWDVGIIAAGFVLRAVAGAFAAAVVISPWFYLCTVFLSLFLALGKRRAELVNVDAGAGITRRNLHQYTVPFLDQLMTIVVTCTIMTYSLYTIQGLGASHGLIVTIPFVIFGIFRYLYLIYVKSEGERPDELLLRDKQILGAVVLCMLVVLAVLYAVPYLHLHPDP